ncbi:MAG: carboxypeptidase M32 [Eubacteriales bacterium]|nr:carboxypeptidase M32 [Eubacteriales bacterium]MDD3882835.1 carboxypeptidase M32 [Eubacteriales bacterium]MDD4513267.1 carboxypeptidase M32 [Eubacteriales bacterium]
MNVNEALEKLEQIELKIYANRHAMSLINYDAYTRAPKGSGDARGKTLSVLAEEGYKLMVNDALREVLGVLLENRDSLSEVDRRRAEVLFEDLEKMQRIPMEEVIAFQELTNKAQDVWHDAKVNNDYASFAPYIDKIVASLKRQSKYIDSDRDAYDVQLGEYEKGMDTKKLDAIFGEMKAGLRPLIEKVSSLPIRDDFLRRKCDIAKQRELSDRLMSLMGIDRNHCTIDETEHPFTDNFSKYDVRITTHYYDDAVASSLYSVVHEGGHALYELHTADELQYTCLASGTSMGVHESQSRFYENIIGRSRAFVSRLYPMLRELFPNEYSDVSEDELYRALNKAEPSLIRTEADELTYTMHIIIRYEIEKMLFSGEVTSANLPETWNRLYKEYLGIDVPDDKRGVLQDSHWSGGAMGYFPSYALGSAYGAQMLAAMQKDIDVFGSIKSGDFSKVNGWLENKIHRYGRMLDPTEVVPKACGSEFSPKYYIEYLSEKLKDVYGI